MHIGSRSSTGPGVPKRFPCSGKTPSVLVAFLALMVSTAAGAAEASLEERVRALEAAYQQLLKENAELRAMLGARGARASVPEASSQPVQSGTNGKDTITPIEGEVAASELSRLSVGGDFRLRYEYNAGVGNTAVRDRGVLRARLGATYRASDRLTLGARLATGDPDDPNSTDIMLADFVDDLSASLDLAYARLQLGALEVTGGKFPNPFLRSELVWDGDVNPQGLTFTYRLPAAGGISPRLTAIHFLVEEQAGSSGSAMNGLQLGFARAGMGPWSFDAAVAYYDYELDSLVGAGPGDLRSNLLTPDGTAYLSDFDLLDTVVAVTYAPVGTRWPVRGTLDLVRNLGAATAADTGYGIDLAFGKIANAGDVRFTYGYAVVETDAVLAAFSHDNTTLATNYRQYTLAIDYLLTPNIVLNGTWYRYREKERRNPALDGWLDRVRLNFMVQF